MARVVSPAGVSSSPVSPVTKHRFLSQPSSRRHRQCLAAMREYFSEERNHRRRRGARARAQRARTALRERRRGAGDSRTASKVQRGHRPSGWLDPVAAALTHSLRQLRDTRRTDSSRGGPRRRPVASPDAAIARALDSDPSAVGSPACRSDVVAAGKAAWTMARAFSRARSARVRRGVVAGPRVGDAALPASSTGSRRAPVCPTTQAWRRPRPRWRSRVSRSAEADAWLVVLLSGGVRDAGALRRPA